jgi:hypothetical protein
MPSTARVSSWTFEAPTKEWASRCNTPTINIYLYDIRGGLERHEVEYEDILDAEGRVVCGAQLLVSSGDPGRMRSEASFAALAGTSPVAAGKTTREARRCVKRALARHFYRRLRELPTLPLTT